MLYTYAWLLVLFVLEALRLLGRLAEHHRAAQHRADVARVAAIKIGRAAGGHALAVGVARARRRRGSLIGGEDGRRRRRVELAEVDGVAGGAVRRVLDVLARLEERALEVVFLEEVQDLVVVYASMRRPLSSSSPAIPNLASLVMRLSL